MAAILQFRQGSKTSFISSGPFVSEPFYDTDTDIIHIGKSGSATITLVKLDEVNSGSLSLSGDLTASNISVSGDISGSSFNGTGLVSGSSQVAELLPEGTLSGSSQVESILPSGVISGSAQIQYLGFDGYGNWRVRSDGGSNINVFTNYVVDIQGGNGITTTQNDSGALIEINVNLDTGSAHFTDAVSEVGAPTGTISGSEQLPDGLISGSEQLPSGIVSGSSQTLNHLESETLVGINITNPTSYGSDGELQINGTTTGYSGILQLLSGSTSTYVNYVTEADKMVNFQAEAGYGLQLTPDSTSSKSWVIDTDGDLVGQGTNDVYAEYVHADISNTTITTASLDDREILFKNTNDNIEGSSIYSVPSTATIAINDATPASGGVNGELIINSTTSGFSGLLTQDIAETTIYQQYGTSADSLVNFMASAGYGLYFSVDGDTKSWTIDTDGDLVAGGNYDVYTNNLIASGIVSGSNIHSEGTVTAEGDIIAYASSDERLKDEIIPISNPIDKINSIGGYSFLWNNEKQNIYKGKDYGVIAQEIENILPELVDNRKDGYKAVKYDRLVSLLIEGIKELSSEVKELKEKINKE